MRVLGRSLVSWVVAWLLAFPVLGSQWEAVHLEMREALAVLSKEYFEAAPGSSIWLPDTFKRGAAKPSNPRLIIAGFAGGVETKDSRSSGVVVLNRRLEGQLDPGAEALVLAYNNFRWRRAATDVIEAARAAQAHGLPGIRQPLIVVYGHSWGAGSITGFARELKNHDLEISLAVYIDSFVWRNPRVPDNVRYAVNFYQRAGVLQGLPLRGKAKLIPRGPDRTRILGSYEIKPDAGRWGWSWNPLQPLFYRQHHLIAHDVRLQRYLLDIASLKLELLDRVQAAPQDRPAHLFDRVVILGASVSSGEKAPSPGLLLARHMGAPEERIHTFAEGGAPSDRHLGFLDNIAKLRPTLIVALDLFYHDFAASLFLSENKKRYLHEYLTRLHDTGAVVVVGNIPRLVLLRHEHVNRYLEELAADFPNLVLVDTRRQIDALAPPGLRVRKAGKELLVKKSDVFADRVHPNLLGSTLAANHILELLKERFPERLPSGNGLLAGAAPEGIPLPLP